MNAPVVSPLQKVIAGANFVNVRLVEVQAKLVDLSIQEYEYTLEIRGKTPPILEREGKRFLLPICTVTLHSKSGGPVPFVASVAMEAVYELTDPAITLADCDDFIKQNVPFNLWPYFRETFQSLSGRMQLAPPMVLPLMKPSLAITGEGEEKK